MERVKWINNIKNAVVLEEQEKNAGTDKEEGKKLAGSLAKQELPAEGHSRRNGKGVEGPRQKKSDDRQRQDKWTV